MIKTILKLKKRNPDISSKKNYIRSSILIPIIKDNDDLLILFEVRSEKLKKQPNEICFPGGRIEEGENELIAAIRETSEELCLDSENVYVVGSSNTLITPFNYIIYTYIGILNNYNYSFNSEVNEVFTVPLSCLLSQKPLCHYINVNMQPRNDFPFHLIQNGKSYEWGKGKYPVYFYTYKDRIIWGITARIIYDFISLIKELQIDNDN